MADLGTVWMGLPLRSPIVLAASPLSKAPQDVRRAVAAGAGAVVMHSLFEEQVVDEQMAAHRFIDMRRDADAEARSVLPDADMSALDGDAYVFALEHLRQQVDVPIIASLNGTTAGGWVRFADMLAQAGADALELNLYDIATDPDEDAAQVEARQLALVEAVVRAVPIPVCVKLSPFYTALPAFVLKLAGLGVSGVTVFNRLYQPVPDIDALEVRRELMLSTPADLPLRLQALALLSPLLARSAGGGQVVELACSGGVHSGRDAAAAVVCGAQVVQLASTLLEKGPDHVAAVLAQLDAWLDEKGYASVAEARGVLDLSRTPDPHAWYRLNYMQLLEGWQPSIQRRQCDG
ncbi:MAG: dihydroorotate dehydrogenase-like protein [Proteobacteria bacterium]|nr:dihydroorotate dehydrogenase-like protein [Pseudomonadota bacterium]